MKPKLGPTGQFPQGKVNPSDEGEIRIALAADVTNRIVRINFGKPVAWLGFNADEADQLADMIKEKAAEVRRRGN